jgi:hypothetical protein
MFADLYNVFPVGKLRHMNDGELLMAFGILSSDDRRRRQVNYGQQLEELKESVLPVGL